MSETVDDQKAAPERQDQLHGGGSTIRRQLILASLFPLAFFGMLSILVISVALNQVTLRLALQGNKAAVQAAAAWWFEPPKVGGKPAIVRVRVPFKFSK